MSSRYWIKWDCAKQRERNSPWSKTAQDQTGFLKAVYFEKENTIRAMKYKNEYFNKLGRHMLSMMGTEN